LILIPADFDFLWSNGETSNYITVNPTTTTQYTVTVTDGNGCSAITGTTVAVSDLNANITAQNEPVCDGSLDGSATVTALNGTPPYTFSWSNGGSGATISGLDAGSYTVTVTDSNSSTCEVVRSVSLNYQTEIELEITNVSTLTCEGDTDGQVNMQVNNGTAPYTYTVTGVGSNNTGVFNNLGHGFYPVSVVDGNGCEATGGFFVQYENCNNPYQQLELHDSPGNPTAMGPTTNPQTVRFVENSNDPIGNTTNAVSPAVTATFSLQDQQYTSTPCSSTGEAMVFGGRNNSTGCSHVPTEIYGSFIPSDPTNDMYTSFPSNPTGTGIDLNDNYGIRIHNSFESLDGLTANWSYYMGQLRIDFSEPVDYPVLHFAGLGAIFGAVGFTTDYELTYPALNMYAISGNHNFEVQTNTVRNSATVADAYSDSGAASGSAIVDAEGVTELIFNVMIRGTQDANFSSTGTAQRGDALTVSLSFMKGEALSCCKTIFQNGFVRTNMK